VSFGVTLWEIVEKTEPFPHLEATQAAIEVAKNHIRLPVPRKAPVILRKLMKSCFKDDPSERPSFDDVIDMIKRADTAEWMTGTPSVMPDKKATPVTNLNLAIDGSMENAITVMFDKKLAISRKEVERALTGTADGTFIIRYSETAKSFVLSYVDDGNIIHVAYIYLEENHKIRVHNSDETDEMYEDIVDYIAKLKDEGKLSDPLYKYCM